VSTRYEQRLDDGNLRNYGRMVVDLASVVPDGLVVFFVSYSYMDYVIARWHEEGLLAELINHKLIFIETQVGALGGMLRRASQADRRAHTPFRAHAQHTHTHVYTHTRIAQHAPHHHTPSHPAPGRDGDHAGA
jgi:hypothetical protein